MNPPPNPEAWAALSDATDRTSHGLGELYDYFSRTEEMFSNIYRDADAYPSLMKIMNGFNGYLRGLADVLTAGWSNQSGNLLLSALLQHAVKFSTWRALNDDGLANSDKLRLILQCADAIAEPRKASG